jgi:hypothetical protein
MTHNEFSHIVESLGALSPEQMEELRRELDTKLATAAKRPAGQGRASLGPTRDVPQLNDQEVKPINRDTKADPVLGSMRDAADELDEIVADAMQRRREEPWRVMPGE